MSRVFRVFIMQHGTQNQCYQSMQPKLFLAHHRDHWSIFLHGIATIISGIILCTFLSVDVTCLTFSTQKFFSNNKIFLNSFTFHFLPRNFFPITKFSQVVLYRIFNLVLFSKYNILSSKCFISHFRLRNYFPIKKCSQIVLYHIFNLVIFSKYR